MHLNLWIYLRWRIKKGSRTDVAFVSQLKWNLLWLVLRAVVVQL